MLDLPDDPVPPLPDGAVLNEIASRRTRLRKRRQRRRILGALAVTIVAMVGAGSYMQGEQADVDVAATARCVSNPAVGVPSGETLRASVLPSGFMLTEGSENDVGATWALRYSSANSKDRWILLSRQERTLEAASPPETQAGFVHGHRAVISDSTISWQATQTVVITVSVSGLGTEEVRRTADGVVYEPGTVVALTDADLAPRTDLGDLEAFYRQQLQGTIEDLHLRQMFIADLTAAAATSPADLPLPRWIGPPSATVVVLLATGDLQAQLPGTPGTASGQGAFAYVTDTGGAGLGLLPMLPSVLKDLPDRGHAACRTAAEQRPVVTTPFDAKHPTRPSLLELYDDPRPGFPRVERVEVKKTTWGAVRAVLKRIDSEDLPDTIGDDNEIVYVVVQAGLHTPSADGRDQDSDDQYTWGAMVFAADGGRPLSSFGRRDGDAWPRFFDHLPDIAGD